MGEIIIKYRYERYDSYPFASLTDSNGMTNVILDNCLSRHHIIAFPYMYAFGAMILTYLHIKYNPNKVSIQDSELLNFYKYYYNAYVKNIDYNITHDNRKRFHNPNNKSNPNNDNNARRESARKQYYSRPNTENTATDTGTIVPAVLEESHRFYGNAINYHFTDTNSVATLNRLAWTPENLFIGPAGKFRGDDPASNCDKIPISMKARSCNSKSFNRYLYDKYQQMLADKRKYDIALTKNDYGYIYIDETELIDFSTNFLSRLKNLTAVRREHNTLVNDWVAIRRNSNGRISSACFKIYIDTNKEHQAKYEQKKYNDYVLCLAYNSSSFIKSHNTPNLNICQEQYVSIFGMKSENNIFSFKGVVIKGQVPKNQAHQEIGALLSSM